MYVRQFRQQAAARLQNHFNHHLRQLVEAGTYIAELLIWRATIDGKPAPLIAANIAYQALRVPAGAHEIEFRYSNPLVRWFGIVSIATLIALAILAMIPQRDRAQL